jgi:hypothetical protein
VREKEQPQRDGERDGGGEGDRGGGREREMDGEERVDFYLVVEFSGSNRFSGQ